MKIDITKTSLTLLLLSLPFNFIAISGVGNIYLSTIVVLIQFAILFLLVGKKLVSNITAIAAIAVFLVTLISTVFNVLIDSESVIVQLKQTVIYFQNILSIILMTYFVKSIYLDYFFKLFLGIILISIIRVYIEEPDHIFMLSVYWEERIESEFVAGVNTFALFNGLAFTISFFYLKNKFLKLSFCIVFIIMIILTMSRGALLAVILTVFIAALYDIRRKTFRDLIKYTFYILLAGVFVLIFTGKMEEIIDLISRRFFSFFDENVTIDKFFAGRGTLISFVFSDFMDSSLFQFLFGHGNGSMNFVIPETGQKFETSHLVILDVLYRNGIILTFSYIILLVVILLKFLKNRSRDKIVLFGLFVFFQLELLVNPMIFSAQAGWVYSMFLVLFLRQNHLIIKKPLNDR